MISKEKLVNGYIKNDEGELRQLFVDAAKSYGYELADESEEEGVNWLDWEYVFINQYNDISTIGSKPLYSSTELFVSDFTETLSEITKQDPISAPPCSEYTKITAADIQGLRDTTSSDIFKRMLSIAKENNLFIQFDGFTQDEDDAIVVTHAISDTEYVVKDEVEFNKLVESLNVLEKFERK